MLHPTNQEPLILSYVTTSQHHIGSRRRRNFWAQNLAWICTSMFTDLYTFEISNNFGAYQIGIKTHDMFVFPLRLLIKTHITSSIISMMGQWIYNFLLKVLNLECLESFIFVCITSQSSIIILNSCIPRPLFISICDANFYKVIICQ